MLKSLSWIALLGLTGCSTFQRTDIGHLFARQRVDVQFAPARDLEAYGDTARHPLPAVTRLEGSVTSVRADTLVIAMGSVRSSVGLPPLPGDLQVAFVPGPETEIAARRISTGRTLGMLIPGVLLGVVLMARDMPVFFGGGPGD